jgi:ubiquitin-conjugating enzyme E2 W
MAGNEWSPVLNAVAVCITMQSMLASNKKKERWVAAHGTAILIITMIISVKPARPPVPVLHPALTDLARPQGNDRYVRTAPSNPKLTRWQYDDDVS